MIVVYFAPQATTPRATFSDVYVAIVQFPLRRQFGRKYDVKHARNTQAGQFSRQRMPD
jgi:hypothetical protein